MTEPTAPQPEDAAVPGAPTPDAPTLPIPPYGAAAPVSAPPAYPAPAYQAPGYPPPAYPAPSPQAPGYAVAHPPTPYPPAAQPHVPPPGYTPAYGYAGYAPRPRTNVLSVVAMVSSIAGVVLAWTWILSLGVIVGVITGHIALRQIARTGEGGRGMALTGVIIGWISIAFGFLILLGIVMFFGMFGMQNGMSATGS